MNTKLQAASYKLQARLMVINFLFVFFILAGFAFAQEPVLPVMAPPAQGALVNKPSEQTKITLDIKGMDIVDVLKMLATRSGMNIIVGKNVTGRVTLFLKDVDIWDAFEIALLANDLAYERKGDIINVMTQRDYELIYGERFQDKKKVKLVQLKYARAADLSRALTQIKTNIGRIVVDEGSNTLVLVDTADNIKQMEDFIKNTDMPVEARVFNLNYAQADKLSAKIQELITKGVGSMKIDERTNKIAITDYPEKLNEIAKIIAAFDEKTPQVLIDAQIVEISPKKDEFSMGVDWDYWIKKNVHLISALPAPPLVSAAAISTKLAFGVASGDQSATVDKVGQYKTILAALRVIGETKILSSPRIMVLNNQEAKILVGTKDAYITSTTSQGGSGNTVTSQTVNFVDVGIKLYVTPTINRDGFITIKVRPEVSSSETITLKSDDKDTQVPKVTTSETETTIMVQDGVTIIIAGLKKDKRSGEVKKVPILGDIPLLGWFFKNIRDESTKTELVIFLTTHIVSGEEPLEYTSLTQDKDIALLQGLANAEKGKGRVLKQPEFSKEYAQLVSEKIRNSSLPLKNTKDYPKGEVEVSFTLDRSGRLRDEPQILYSSEDKLNSLVLRGIKQASPFPPLPEGIGKERENFRIVLEYK